MRAACDLYVHPELSTSEVWAKDAYNRSGKTRMLAAIGVLSITLLSVAATCQYLGYLDMRSLHTSLLWRSDIIRW